MKRQEELLSGHHRVSLFQVFRYWGKVRRIGQRHGEQRAKKKNVEKMVSPRFFFSLALPSSRLFLLSERFGRATTRARVTHRICYFYLVVNRYPFQVITHEHALIGQNITRGTKSDVLIVVDRCYQ